MENYTPIGALKIYTGLRPESPDGEPEGMCIVTVPFKRGTVFYETPNGGDIDHGEKDARENTVLRG